MPACPESGRSRTRAETPTVKCLTHEVDVLREKTHQQMLLLRQQRRGASATALQLSNLQAALVESQHAAALHSTEPNVQRSSLQSGLIADSTIIAPMR